MICSNSNPLPPFSLPFRSVYLLNNINSNFLGRFLKRLLISISYEYLFWFSWWVLEKTEDGRQVLILDSTIFHPQGGGQPADLGLISNSDFKFIVQDVRSKDKIVCFFFLFIHLNNLFLPFLCLAVLYSVVIIVFVLCNYNRCIIMGILKILTMENCKKILKKAFKFR